MIGRIGVGIGLIELGIGLIELGMGLIELGIGLMELVIGLRINNARRTVLARVSGLVCFLFLPFHDFPTSFLPFRGAALLAPSKYERLQ